MYFLATPTFQLLGVQRTEDDANALVPAVTETLQDADLTRDDAAVVVIESTALIAKLRQLRNEQSTESGTLYVDHLIHAVTRIRDSKLTLNWTPSRASAERDYIDAIMDVMAEGGEYPEAFEADGMSIGNPYMAASGQYEVNPLMEYHVQYIEWFNDHFENY
jgi:hypothetical protein